jgi:hypothetical protein
MMEFRSHSSVESKAIFMPEKNRHGLNSLHPENIASSKRARMAAELLLEIPEY